MMTFRQYIDSQTLGEATLYHGTVNDHSSDISRYGLMPTPGKFVKQMYAGTMDDQDWDDDMWSATYAADKKSLSKAVTAMKFQIAQKLKKNMSEVNLVDIRNHGMLVVIKNGHDQMTKHDPYDYSSANAPASAETGDWYSKSDVPADFNLIGAALLRFLKSHRVI